MNRALVTVATGEYNQYIPELIESSQEFFGCNFYLFTDSPELYEHYNIRTIKIEHLGWPRMPLLRFELLNEYIDIFKEQYIFLIDSEAVFKQHVKQDILSYRVATLHRNITRFRQDFNYETRKESTAYVNPREGEKYYACGFVGGYRKEFKKMCSVITENIRTDINNNIRALWGDESHLNRYLIDNKPTLVLPPSYMCPFANNYFIPYIQHRDKKFKRVEKEDAKLYLKVNPEDYKVKFKI
jgi:hypothetical protein